MTLLHYIASGAEGAGDDEGAGGGCIARIVKENPELDLNARDGEGNTPLHLAAKNNKDEGRDSVTYHWPSLS